MMLKSLHEDSRENVSHKRNLLNALLAISTAMIGSFIAFGTPPFDRILFLGIGALTISLVLNIFYQVRLLNTEGDLIDELRKFIEKAHDELLGIFEKKFSNQEEFKKIYLPLMQKKLEEQLKIHQKIEPFSSNYWLNTIAAFFILGLISCFASI